MTSSVSSISKLKTNHHFNRVKFIFRRRGISIISSFVFILFLYSNVHHDVVEKAAIITSKSVQQEHDPSPVSTITETIINESTQNTATTTSEIIQVESNGIMNNDDCATRSTNSNDLDLKAAQAVERDLSGITIDLSYKLNVPSNWWKDVNISPSYDESMNSLHGMNIWKEEGLKDHIDFLGLTEPPKLHGSPLDNEILLKLLDEIKPKVFLEVGVYHGMTSIKVAKHFRSNKNNGFENSYILSMDTWLLDIRFTWSGIKSKHQEEVKHHKYFDMQSKSGGSIMYYQFLSNCIKSKTTDYIIPIATATQNGAMSLLSHGVRPELMYIDASHSNPDVFIDYENFYTILKPGGAIAFDDVGIPSVKAALDKLVDRYELELFRTHKQGYIYKAIE